MRARWEAFEVVLHGFIEQLVIGKQVREAAQFGAGGQSAHYQEMGNLDEGRALSQFLYRNTPVTKDAFLAVNKRNPTLAGTGVGIAVIQGDEAGLIAQRGNVNRTF